MTPWPHTVTVHPSTAEVDGDGNPVRRPVPAGVVVAGFVQPIRATEDTADGQAAQIEAMAWLDESAPELDAFSRLTVHGATYESVGAALFFTDPDETVRFWRVNLRKVG